MKNAIMVTALLMMAIFLGFSASTGASLLSALQNMGWQSGNLLLPGMALLGVAMCRRISIEPKANC